MTAMDDLGHRLSVLDVSLEKFKPESKPSWQTAEIFNALLAAVKEMYPDDPIVKAISPAKKDELASGVGQEVSAMDAGSMRAAIGQMHALTGLEIGIG